MTKFDLPKLLSITSPNNTFLEPMLVVKNNASFEFSTTEAQRWLNISGQSALPIPVEIPPPPPTAAPAPTPSTRSPDQIRDQNKKNQEENEKTESEGSGFTKRTGNVEFSSDCCNHWCSWLSPDLGLLCWSRLVGL